MPLTDIAIRAAKHGSKPTKLADEKGLFLLLQPSGGKLWRLKYRFAGKEKKLSLGTYPDVALKDARKRRDEARSSLADGIDPAHKKKADAIAAKISAKTSFKAVADEYLEKASREGREAVTIRKSRWLLSLMEADLGARPIAEITSAELLSALQRRLRFAVLGHMDSELRRGLPGNSAPAFAEVAEPARIGWQSNHKYR